VGRIRYNRFIRWSRLGVFNRIFAALAGEGPRPERIMIDATHLKAHRTAASLLKRMARPVCKQFLRSGKGSLRQRIRSQDRALAKMEIRAFRAS